MINKKKIIGSELRDQLNLKLEQRLVIYKKIIIIPPEKIKRIIIPYHEDVNNPNNKKKKILWINKTRAIFKGASVNKKITIVNIIIIIKWVINILSRF